MKKKILTTLVACTLLAPTAWAAPNAGLGNDAGALDAGVQANRLNEYIERERVNREIYEEREKAPAQVEQQKEETKAEEGISFELKKLNVDESRVLTDEEITAITSKYEGQEVHLQAVYDAVEELNKLYESKGYLTCRAYLQAQKIEDGVVRISLYEGETGKAILEGNKHTKDSYILDRLPLKEGEIPSINELNKDILHFNGTNDAQLRVTLKAGEKEGTTDYYITVKEPKNNAWTLFMDNTGSERTGEYRYGLFYNIKSLSGVRDSLTLGTVLTQGNKAYTAMYSRPVGRSGAKINLSYNTTNVKTIKNIGDNKVESKAGSYGIGYVQPWIVTDTFRSELSLDYLHQTSQSDLIARLFKSRIVDDTLDDINLGLAMTSYGKSHIFYQKHTLTFGRSTSSPELYHTTTSDSYTLYKFTSVYNKLYQHGQQLNIRFDGQLSALDNLLSSRQYYIGGMYSVRGYKESLTGAANGFSCSTEYSIPITKDRKASAFVFFDFGHVFGEGAESDNKDDFLYSTGVGVRANIGKNVNGVLTLGIPLKKNFDSKTEPVDSMRLNFMLTAQF